MRAGSLTDYVQVAVVPALLDGGLVHIFRWALDDSTDNTMTAAVYGLHSLLVSQQDEVRSGAVTLRYVNTIQTHVLLKCIQTYGS